MHLKFNFCVITRWWLEGPKHVVITIKITKYIVVFDGNYEQVFLSCNLYPAALIVFVRNYLKLNFLEYKSIVLVCLQFILMSSSFWTSNTRNRDWGQLDIKVKVKCTLVQALMLCTGRTAFMGSRGIALPFLDHGTIRG